MRIIYFSNSIEKLLYLTYILIIVLAQLTDSIPKLKQLYKGKRFTVIHCEGALESFEHAIFRLKNGAKKRLSMTTGIADQIERLASGEPMSQENFCREGQLPSRKGQQYVNYFCAFKKSLLEDIAGNPAGCRILTL